MKEEKVSLHFFIKEHVTNFGAVARSHGVKYEVKSGHNPFKNITDYYITTEPITKALKTVLIQDWAKASMEIIS